MEKVRTVLLTEEFVKAAKEAIILENNIIFPKARIDELVDITITAEHFKESGYVMFAKVYIKGEKRVNIQLDENFFEDGWLDEFPRVIEVNVDAMREDEDWYWDIRFDIENRVEGPLDWDKIEELLKNEPLQKRSEWSYDSSEDGYVRTLFLGTVFGLTPSGKYYMPFACSNLDACPECHGSGSLNVRGKDGNPETMECARCSGVGSDEAWEDQKWNEAMEDEADRRGISLECGEGDPCDIFAVIYYDEDEVDEEPLENV